MDQLKSILNVLQKHHFWLLAVICMISGVVGWSTASKSLSAAYTQKKGNIVSAFDGLKTILTTENFPNAEWKKEIDELTRQEKEQVDKAAIALYDEQKEMLKWPKVLGDEFLEAIEKIPPGGDIQERYRNTYSMEIEKEIPKLLSIIGAAPDEQNKDAASPPKPSGDGKPRVTWEGQNQLKTLIDWKGYAPPSAEVWLAQEDLWVYAAVLKVISKINAEEHILPIPSIDGLYIGSKAADALEAGLKGGHIQGPTVSADADPPQQTQPAPTGGPDAPEGAADAGRYVDATGKPLPGGGGAAKEPFKRMPVFMKLTIAQQAIPKLLVECANSPLPIEVLQLRMNPKGGAAKSNERPISTPSPTATAETEKTNVPLELGGIIYIYNKPQANTPGEQPTPTVNGGTSAPAAPTDAGG